jgi:hypothetical protein
MDEAFGWCEAADQALAEDAALTGVVSALVANETSPASMSISLTGPGLAYDKAGQRCAIAANPTVLSCSVDEYGVPTTVTGVGNERWLGVFVRFKRTLTDPEIDGNGLSVYTREWEGAEVFVRQGTEATIGAALKVPLQAEAILLCDVRLVRLQTTVTNSDILVTRREDWSRCVTTSFGTKVAGTSKAAVTALWSAVDTAASGGGPFTPSETWFAAMAVAGSAPPITTVAEAINAIIYDLAYINPGLGVNGAQKISMPGYSSTYVTWPDCSVAAAVTITGGLLNNHIAGSAPYHPATAVSFSDTTMKAKWGSQATATTVQAALDRITQSLTETGGTPPYPAGATLVRNAALTGYLTETIGASNLNTQLTSFMNLLIDRAHKTLPCTVSTHWHHTEVCGTQSDMDFHGGGQFAKAIMGGGLHPTADLEGCLANKWIRTDHSSGYPYENGNGALLAAGPTDMVVGGCVVLASCASNAQLPDPEMKMRLLVLLGGYEGYPYIYIVDPITGELLTTVDYTAVAATLGAGTWRGEAICSVKNGSFACVFANDANPNNVHKIQAFTISDTGGAFVVARKSGWPATGTTLPGTGRNPWEIDYAGIGSVTASRCIPSGSACIITLNGWNSTDGNDILTSLSLGTGAILSSGRGDAPSSAARYPTPGLATDGLHAFFTTFEETTGVCQLNHCNVSNLSSHALSNLPASFTGGTVGDAVWSVATDGGRVYTGINHTGEMMCYELSTQRVAKLDMSSFAIDYREVAVDGRNVWWNAVSSSNEVHAIRIRAASFPTRASWTGTNMAHEYAIFSNADAPTYSSPTTWQWLGPLIFDGDSMWCIVNSFYGANESMKVRRVIRCQTY